MTRENATSTQGGPEVAERRLHPVEVCVRELVARAPELLTVAEAHGSPLYLLEPDVLRARARTFRAAFAAEIPELGVYYALKSNNLDAIAAIAVEEGLGIDVSSGIELEQAVAAGADDIIFSGPGKTAAELGRAIDLAERVVVLVDSFGELERLQRQAAARGVRVRAGARLSTSACGLWRKFGIPLGELARLLETAAACSHVSLEGLQYHMSWSLSPERQVAFIAALGEALEVLPAGWCRTLRFLDIGGGFWPPEGEWLHADPEAMLESGTGWSGGSSGDPGTSSGDPGTSSDDSGGGPYGRAASAAPGMRAAATAPPPPRILPSCDVGEFAVAIGGALRRHVFPHVGVGCRVHVEPGRWLCNDAMHILITVIDKKAEDLVIVDAGTNAIGWERFESDYFPVINLSRPALEERVCTVFGSLCTPHDVWGFSVHGAGVEPGDVLLVPRQGAYTYSLRQRFIKPLPEVVVRGAEGWAQ